jgi:uncharacterized damage-inducible protein DinB
VSLLEKSRDQDLREHLLKLLSTGSAHLGFDEAIEDLPAELRGKKAPGIAHTVWQLIEHLRIAQEDILEFSRRADYVSPPWPEGYWPEAEAPSSEEEWEQSVESFHRGLRAMKDLVSEPATDLFAKLTWGTGQTILRQAMLVADHNAYHVGQIVTVRQALGAWG